VDGARRRPQSAGRHDLRRPRRRRVRIRRRRWVRDERPQHDRRTFVDAVGRIDLRRRRAGRWRGEPLPSELQVRRSNRAARGQARAAETVMKNRPMIAIVAVALTLLVVSLHAQPRTAQPPARPGGDEQGFRFKSAVELINVTASVSDSSGRFVCGLRQEDFAVYEDDQPVAVTHFNAERVPVSLGIALDTSGSMAGSKIQEAQSALDRFLYELLDKDDEIFLYRFSNVPMLLQGWTRDRQLIS